MIGVEKRIFKINQAEFARRQIKISPLLERNNPLVRSFLRKSPAETSSIFSKKGFPLEAKLNFLSNPLVSEDYSARVLNDEKTTAVDCAEFFSSNEAAPNRKARIFSSPNLGNIKLARTIIIMERESVAQLFGYDETDPDRAASVLNQEVAVSVPLSLGAGIRVEIPHAERQFGFKDIRGYFSPENVDAGYITIGKISEIIGSVDMDISLGAEFIRRSQGPFAASIICGMPEDSAALIIDSMDVKNALEILRQKSVSSSKLVNILGYEYLSDINVNEMFKLEPALLKAKADPLARMYERARNILKNRNELRLGDDCPGEVVFSDKEIMMIFRYRQPKEFYETLMIMAAGQMAESTAAQNLETRVAAVKDLFRQSSRS